MSSQGVMFGKEASNNLGSYPVKGQEPSGSSRIRTWDQFLKLSLCASKTPLHCHRMVVSPAFYLSSILPRDPQGRFRSSKLGEQFTSLQAPWQFHFHIPQNAWGLKTVPQNAGWKCCSLPFGTAVPTGMFFWQPEDLSKPPDYQNKYLHFMFTGPCIILVVE